MVVEHRVLADRRKRPTPALSRYSLLGGRRTFRRNSDQLRGYYVNRYSSSTLALLVSIIGLNILDVLFTIMVLDGKGTELNPIIGAVMAVHGQKFWIWKFLIVSIPSIVLCIHSKFRMVRGLLVGVSAAYIGVVVYQIASLVYQ